MKAIQFTRGQLMEGTRLRYLEEVARTNLTRRRANFQCECGKAVEADLNYVRFLNITSCGCYRSEVVTGKNTKHSHATREDKSGAYRSWQAMHQRVQVNPNYAHVQVCDRWSGEQGFVHFLEDMGDRPPATTIERDKNELGYTPGNCRWATRLEQAQNQRQTTMVTIAGETHSINEWCRLKGILYSMVKQRRARGMSLESAITLPVNTSKQGRKL